MAKKRGLLILGVTFAVFMTEAIVHYNIGLNDDSPIFALRMPTKHDLFRIGAVVLLASLASTTIISFIDKEKL